LGAAQRQEDLTVSRGQLVRVDSVGETKKKRQSLLA